jgi:uncharacterized protein YegP (UPF0339 family)
MAGNFELIYNEDGGYNVRLLDENGDVVATSEPHGSVKAPARGIALMREIASTGLIEANLTRTELLRSLPN